MTGKERLQRYHDYLLDIQTACIHNGLIAQYHKAVDDDSGSNHVMAITNRNDDRIYLCAVFKTEKSSKPSRFAFVLSYSPCEVSNIPLDFEGQSIFMHSDHDEADFPNLFNLYMRDFTGKDRLESSLCSLRTREFEEAKKSQAKIKESRRFVFS